MKKLKDINFDTTTEYELSSENLTNMKGLLDNTGCGFCLAKWTQVTIHLGSGITHSCHHVGAHKIPLEELENNPSALHNTTFKKQRRQEMLNNVRPTECDYCWRIEDNTDDFSDRVLKSISPWSRLDHDAIVASNGTENVFPRYVEVSFSNVCNFKCAYCGPPFSSKWSEEIKQHGPYKLYKTHYNGIKEHEVPYLEREENPYIEAFWKWFPEAVEHMLEFRITGGEPLLSKHTFRVIQHLIDNPQPHLNFSVNTNACPPGEKWKEFVNLLLELEQKNCVKGVTIFVSAESAGKHTEYVRHGMDWKVFSKNVNYLLANTKQTNLSFMSAVNLLSLPSIQDYVKFVLDLKKIYNLQYFRVKVDFAYVRHPHFLDIKIADYDLLETYLQPAIKIILENLDNLLYNKWELDKLVRIQNDCYNRIKRNDIDEQADIDRYRLQLYQFLQEYDRRRGTDFNRSYPEFDKFMEKCR